MLESKNMTNIANDFFNDFGSSIDYFEFLKYHLFTDTKKGEPKYKNWFKNSPMTRTTEEYLYYFKYIKNKESKKSKCCTSCFKDYKTIIRYKDKSGIRIFIGNYNYSSDPNCILIQVSKSKKIWGYI